MKTNEKLKEKRLHDDLKGFLVEVGNREDYRSFSGDSECLDIRLKKRHTEYKPDVVWKSKTSCHVFEFAFTEDWRAIAGEFTLAWLAGCSSFTVFRLADAREHVNGIHTMIMMPDYKETREPFFRKMLGILGEKYSMKWYYLTLVRGRSWDADAHKQIILDTLRRWHVLDAKSWRGLYKYFWDMKMGKGFEFLNGKRKRKQDPPL